MSRLTKRLWLLRWGILLGLYMIPSTGVAVGLDPIAPPQPEDKEILQAIKLIAASDVEGRETFLKEVLSSRLLTTRWGGRIGAVRGEALLALGAINSPEAQKILHDEANKYIAVSYLLLENAKSFIIGELVAPLCKSANPDFEESFKKWLTDDNLIDDRFREELRGYSRQALLRIELKRREFNSPAEKVRFLLDGPLPYYDKWFSYRHPLIRPRFDAKQEWAIEGLNRYFFLSVLSPEALPVLRREFDRLKDAKRIDDVYRLTVIGDVIERIAKDKMTDERKNVLDEAIAKVSKAETNREAEFKALKVKFAAERTTFLKRVEKLEEIGADE